MEFTTLISMEIQYDIGVIQSIATELRTLGNPEDNILDYAAMLNKYQIRFGTHISNDVYQKVITIGNSLLIVDEYFDEAMKLFESFLLLQPHHQNNSQFYNFLGTIYDLRNYFDQAKKCYQKSFNLGYYESYVNLGKMFERIQRIGDAINCFKQVELHDKNNIQVLRHLAAIYKKTRKLQQSIAYNQKILAIKQNDEQASTQLARLYCFNYKQLKFYTNKPVKDSFDNLTMVKKYIQKILQVNESSMEAFEIRIRIYLDEQQFQEAKKNILKYVDQMKDKKYEAYYSAACAYYGYYCSLDSNQIDKRYQILKDAELYCSFAYKQNPQQTSFMYCLILRMLGYLHQFQPFKEFTEQKWGHFLELGKDKLKDEPDWSVTLFHIFIKHGPKHSKTSQIYDLVGLAYLRQYNMNNTFQREHNLFIAEKYYRKAIQCNQKYYLSYQHLGQLMMTMNKLDDALQWYEKLNNINPDNIKILIKIATIKFQKKDMFKARKYCQKCVEIYERSMKQNVQKQNQINQQVFVQLQNLLLKLNRKELVQKISGNIINVKSQIHKAFIQLGIGQKIQAFNSFSRIILKQINIDFYIYIIENIGLIYCEQLISFLIQNYQRYNTKGQTIVFKVLKLIYYNDTSYDWSQLKQFRQLDIKLYELGSNLFDRGLYQLLDLLCSKFIELFPKHLLLFKMYYFRAMCHLQNYKDKKYQQNQKKEIEITIENFKLSIKQNSTFISSFYSLATFYKICGMRQEAIQCYQQAFNIDRSQGYFLRQLGVLMLDSKKYQSAIFYFKKVIYYNGKTQRFAHSLLGQAYYLAGKFQESILAYKQAIDCRPHDEKPVFSLIDVYISQDKKAQAQQCIKKFSAFQLKKIQNNTVDIDQIVHSNQYTNYFKLGIEWVEQKKYFSAIYMFLKSAEQNYNNRQQQFNMIYQCIRLIQSQTPKCKFHIKEQILTQLFQWLRKIQHQGWMHLYIEFKQSLPIQFIKGSFQNAIKSHVKDPIIFYNLSIFLITHKDAEFVNDHIVTIIKNLPEQHENNQTILFNTAIFFIVFSGLHEASQYLTKFLDITLARKIQEEKEIEINKNMNLWNNIIQKMKIGQLQKSELYLALGSFQKLKQTHKKLFSIVDSKNNLNYLDLIFIFQEKIKHNPSETNQKFIVKHLLIYYRSAQINQIFKFLHQIKLVSPLIQIFDVFNELRFFYIRKYCIDIFFQLAYDNIPLIHIEKVDIKNKNKQKRIKQKRCYKNKEMMPKEDTKFLKKKMKASENQTVNFQYLMRQRNQKHNSQKNKFKKWIRLLTYLQQLSKINQIFVQSNQQMKLIELQQFFMEPTEVLNMMIFLRKTILGQSKGQSFEKQQYTFQQSNNMKQLKSRKPRQLQWEQLSTKSQKQCKHSKQKVSQSQQQEQQEIDKNESQGPNTFKTISFPKTDRTPSSSLNQSSLNRDEYNSQNRQNISDKFIQQKEGILSKSVSLSNTNFFFSRTNSYLSKFKQLLLNNHAHIINYISHKSGQLNYIAKHYFQNYKTTQIKDYNFSYFTLQVEKGEIDLQKKLYQKYSNKLLQIIKGIKCLVEGIIELQRIGLYHKDLQLRNMVLFRNKSSKFFQYKIIDFDHSFLVKKMLNCIHQQNNRKMIVEWLNLQEVEQNRIIANQMLLHLFKDIDQYQNKSYKCSLHEIKNSGNRQIIKVKRIYLILDKFMYSSHRQQFIKLIKQMVEHNQHLNCLVKEAERIGQTQNEDHYKYFLSVAQSKFKELGITLNSE